MNNVNEAIKPISTCITLFKQQHPDGTVSTETKFLKFENDDCAIAKATIYGSPDVFLASAHAIAFDLKNLEDAENRAVQRALAFCGYGTELLTAPNKASTPKIEDTTTDKTAPAESPDAANKDAKENKAKEKKPENLSEAVSKEQTKILSLKNWKHRVLKTVVPCGQYRGSTFEELMQNKLLKEIWFFADSYVPHTAEDTKVIAAAKCVKTSYEQKLKEQKQKKTA